MRSARLLALAIAAVAIPAVVAQTLVFIDLAAARGWGIAAALWIVASYFTILTNILIVAVCLAFVSARWAAWWPAPRHVFGALATAIATAATVYHLLLSRLWDPQGMHWWADLGLHTIVPAAFIVFWLAHAPKRGLVLSDAIRWLVYPLGYFAYVMTRASFDGWYPYPFLDAGRLGPGGVLANALGLAAILAAGGAGLIVLGRFLGREDR